MMLTILPDVPPDARIDSCFERTVHSSLIASLIIDAEFGFFRVFVLGAPLRFPRHQQPAHQPKVDHLPLIRQFILFYPV